MGKAPEQLLCSSWYLSGTRACIAEEAEIYGDRLGSHCHWGLTISESEKGLNGFWGKDQKVPIGNMVQEQGWAKQYKL